MIESVSPTSTTGSGTRVPGRVFREGEDGDGEGVDLEEVVDVEQRENTREDPVKIRCDACRSELTSVEESTEVDGAHRHVKVNPHGHVFHIRCFDRVPGTVAVGRPSPEFSWFSGYRWQIAVCGDCQTHVGWRFSGDGTFEVLIEGRIVEGAAD